MKDLSSSAAELGVRAGIFPGVVSTLAPLPPPIARLRADVSAVDVLALAKARRLARVEKRVRNRKRYARMMMRRDPRWGAGANRSAEEPYTPLFGRDPAEADWRRRYRARFASELVRSGWRRADAEACAIDDLAALGADAPYDDAPEYAADESLSYWSE